MKKLLSLTLALLMLLSFTACGKDVEPPPSGGTDGESMIQPSPYAHTDLSDRYYTATDGYFNGFVYGNEFYYGNSYGYLVSVPLPNWEGTAQDTMNTEKPFCNDALCDHVNLTCTAFLRDPTAEFLIDSTESAGGFPIAYYYRCVEGNVFSEDPWNEDWRYEIIRADSATNLATQIALVNSPIVKMISYGNMIYFVTQTAEQNYLLNSVKKTGGEISTAAVDEPYINLIGANKDGVYFNDSQGNVYMSDSLLVQTELIYTVANVYPMSANYTADLGMFVDSEYLYFYDDFEALTAPNDPLSFIRDSLHRIKLSEPDGAGEVVATDIFQNSVYGIYNGILYYAPFNVMYDIQGGQGTDYISGSYCFSLGTVKGVRLDTLECFDVITDSGYNMVMGDFYINDRCLIGCVGSSYRRGNGITSQNAGRFISLLDFETGALYNIHTGFMLYAGSEPSQ